MIRFSTHAKARMAQRGVTAAEVFAVIASPSGRRDVATGNIDFFGRTTDGRPVQITLDPRRGEDGLVVTVIAAEKSK